jgi:3-deoxy-D-manno-octulosonic-acid transferase
MYFLYSLLLVLWGLLLIPAFACKAWRRGRRLPGVAQRLGRLPETLRYDGRPVVWFHSCSVGETLSLEPLTEFLHARIPEARFVFSTVTETGRQVAIQRFSRYGEGNVFYFPVDLASVAGRVLDWIRPVMMVIVDTEIWPNILHQAYRRGIPVVMANGRISTSSFRYYRRARPLLSRVLREYRILMMQSEEDASRIASMGAPSEKVLVTGNIKFDRNPAGKETDESLARSLAEDFGLGAFAAPLIVAGSTHPGEEPVLLEALRRLRSLPATGKTRLLLAPRHPERFDAVARIAEERGFRVRRRSEGPRAGRDEEVLLLDTMGELAAAYRFATIVFVGGTLTRRGGHSILEPAQFAKPIVIGPSMDNFRHVLNEFESRNAVVRIRAEEDDPDLQVQQLMDVFSRLLQNSKDREALGAAAFSILEKNRGATERTGEKIAALFEEARGRALPGKAIPGRS